MYTTYMKMASRRIITNKAAPMRAEMVLPAMAPPDRPPLETDGDSVVAGDCGVDSVGAVVALCSVVVWVLWTETVCTTRSWNPAFL